MTVKELREWLSTFPDDMEVVETRYSDVGPMELSAWGTIDGIPQVSGAGGWIQWVQRPSQLSEENKSKLRAYVHFGGN